MPIVWKLPGEPPDPAAITRLRQHFREPDELMPEPWFMGSEILFYTWLAEEPPAKLETEEFCRAINDIASGVFCFPEVQYVPVWKAWFRYLLSDAILRADDPENINNYSRSILNSLLTACFNIYPDQITEEYRGFRNDLVSMLGTRAIPQKLARELTQEREKFGALFVDIWDAGRATELYGLESFQEVNGSILFCLKYMTPAEVTGWAASLFQIDSPQWYLQFIMSLAAWRKTTRLAKEWNNQEKHFLRKILSESEMFGEFFIPKFNSFNAFIPASNVEAFEQSIAAHFSFDIFRLWTNEIWLHLNAAPYNIKYKFYLNHSLAEELRRCESISFPQARADGNSISLAYDQAL